MAPTEYDAIVVGGGFGGIYSTYHLRKQGYNVKSFEKGSKIGGIWYWNKYPGARVDSDVPVYQLWIKEVWKDWNFKERFPGWEELEQYFEHVEDSLKISKNYSFNTFVGACTFDKETGKWTVTTTGQDAGTFVCKHLIICIGFAAKNYIPAFDGIDRYKGIMYHTAEWPGDTIDFKDRKVAVIGTGASGVQVIQETGPIVKEMTVYQRTPNLALPMRQRRITDEEQNKRKVDYDGVFADTLTEPNASGFEFGFVNRSAFDDTPEEQEKFFQDLWAKGGFNFWAATYNDVWTNMDANNIAYKFWRKETLKRLKRPEFHELLAPEVPPNPFAGKRPCLEQAYYEVYNQPNIDIVPLKEEPIIEFTERGIKTKNGEKEFDIVVLATGFDAVTGGLLQMDIRGIDGITLPEKWNEGTKTYLGMMINGFPNMYFMYGPQGPTAFSNGPTCAQIQAKWIINLIQYADKQHDKYVQPTIEAEEYWHEACDKALKSTLVYGVKGTWYTGGNIPGKRVEALNYLGGVPVYNREINKEANEGYKNLVFVK